MSAVNNNNNNSTTNNNPIAPNTNKNMERPGPRDILFPTLSADVHIFKHKGNRCFFTALALFLEDYARNPQALSSVSMRVMTCLENENYRFLKLGPDGVFLGLTPEESLERIKGCFQSQASNLAAHIQKYNIRKHAQLVAENRHIVHYAEQVAEQASTGTIDTCDYWVRPRKKNANTNRINTTTDTTTARNNATNNVIPIQPAPQGTSHNNNNMAAAAPAVTNNNNNNKTNKSHATKTIPAKKTTIAKPPKRNIKSLDAIVIASMQQGVLPIGGNWKFFPLPELQNKVNLGAESTGWQLRLEPISMPGDPVILDVPFA